MKRERPVDERGDRKGLVKREKAASNRTLPLEAALRGTRDQLVTALEDVCNGAPAACDVLLPLACEAQDSLIAELGVRAMMRVWGDPSVVVDDKMAAALVARVSDASTPRTVVAQLLRSGVELLAMRPLPALAAELCAVALHRTSDLRGAVRALAVEALCALADEQRCVGAQVPAGLLRFARADGDASVRAAALQGLLTLDQRALAPLRLSALWPVAVALLNDDAPVVRGRAVALLAQLGTRFATDAAPDAVDTLVANRVCVLLCNMVCDPDLEVRVRAATLLGSLRGVHRHVLLQALFKTPLEGVSVPLMETGADADTSQWTSGAHAVLGAFVHALEEEYWEVRMAALGSMCALSAQDAEFTRHALDYVVDMLHDENSEVRLAAIHALRQMGAASIRSDHLSMLHFLLSEESASIRHAVHKLLADVTHPDVAVFQATIQALLTNLVRHPHDTDVIMATLAGLGKRHPHFCALLVETLLRLDRRFVVQERAVSDPVYLATLLLLVSSDQTQLLPEFALRHREYVQSRWAWLFDSAPAVATVSGTDTKLASTSSLAHDDVVAEALELWRDGFAEPALAVVDGALSMEPAPTFACRVLQAVRVWLLLQSGTGDATTLRQQLVEISLRLEHEFSGLSPALLDEVRAVRAAAKWDPRQQLPRPLLTEPRRIGVSLRVHKALLPSPQLLSFVAQRVEIHGSVSNVSIADLEHDVLLLTVFPDCTWITTALDASDWATGTAPLECTFTKAVALRLAAKSADSALLARVWLVRRVRDTALAVGISPVPSAKGSDGLGGVIALHEQPLLFPLNVRHDAQPEDR